MKPTSGLGCTTRKTPGSIGRSAKPGYHGADRYSDADTGKLAARRKPLQAPATPCLTHSNEREGSINYPKPRISSDTRVIISAYLFRKIER
jgi:hypothetical protein